MDPKLWDPFQKHEASETLTTALGLLVSATICIGLRKKKKRKGGRKSGKAKSTCVLRQERGEYPHFVICEL